MKSFYFILDSRLERLIRFIGLTPDPCNDSVDRIEAPEIDDYLMCLDNIPIASAAGLHLFRMCNYAATLRLILLRPSNLFTEVNDYFLRVNIGLMLSVVLSRALLIRLFANWDNMDFKARQRELRERGKESRAENTMNEYRTQKHPLIVRSF
jgi:hypothetical protein